MLIVRRKQHNNLPILELAHHNVDSIPCSSSNPFTLYNANGPLLYKSVREKYPTVNSFHVACVTLPARHALSHRQQPRRRECSHLTTQRHLPTWSDHCMSQSDCRYSDPTPARSLPHPQMQCAYH